MVSEKERCAISETGTGFAGAKLSGGQRPSPAARVARFVRMTEGAHGAGAHHARDLFVAQLRIEYYFERRWSEPVIVLSSATVRCAPSSWSRNFAATSVS